MLNINKLMLVTGVGGARMDFVAGWLGTLPNFLDNVWSIDPATGRSYGDMSFAKTIDFEPNALDHIINVEFNINKNSNVSAVGACHGWNLDAHIQTINSNNIEILAIDTDQVPHSTIIWNFFVKTFLSNIRTRHAYTYNEFWLIDRKINQDVITNDIRLAELKSHINQIKDIKKQTISVPSTVPYKKLLYKELFQKGGSYYLTKQLNINVESRYHQIWDCLLPVANAPDELTVLGHTWRKQDYFNS